MSSSGTGPRPAQPLSRSSAADRCPVCNARFRGTPSCSRCGADLRPLMSLAARAVALRNRARRALAAGDAARAANLAHHANLFASHPSARALRLLAGLIA